MSHTHHTRPNNTHTSLRDPHQSAPFCPFCSDPNAEGLPVTQECLNDYECPSPECDEEYHIYFEPKCHPSAAMLPEYCREHGTMTLVCAECGEMQASILVGLDHQKVIQVVFEKLMALDKAEEGKHA